MTAPFLHLRAHSAYSLLNGAIKVGKLVGLAKAHQMPALGLVDHDNLFGSLEFSEYAVKEGIQPIIGMTLSLVPFLGEKSGGMSGGNASARHAPDQLLLYAKNEQGYANLLKLASAEYVSPARAGEAPLADYAMLAKYADGLMALTASTHGGVGRALLGNRAGDAEQLLLHLKELFGDRLYVELTRHKMLEERQIERAQIDLALKHNLPLIATNNVYFTDAGMFEAHDALVCIAGGRYVTETDRPKITPEHRFKSPEEMCRIFQDIPEATQNTLHFAQRCTVWAPSRSPILPGFRVEVPRAKLEARGQSLVASRQSPVVSEARLSSSSPLEGEPQPSEAHTGADDEMVVLSESDALRQLASDGLEARLARHVFTPEMTDEEKTTLAKPYWDRLEFELDVIITMKFPGYFLIVSDFITWAKQQDIPVGPGRGSGAGSLVAWVLLITDLDPLRYGLIFERFLNPERVSMPDFDIDFCQDRRDEVIQYVRRKYGDDRVAQIITFGKLQARAVLRDVGRVLQMPYSQVDRICKLVPANPANPVTLGEAIDLEPLLKAAIEEDETVEKLVALALKLEGLYRHASTHAAGVVIGDRPLDELVPLYCDPKSDMLVVQYSMKWAEAAGLVKFDFLGLRTLTILQKAVKILASRGIEIALDTLPEGDKKTYALMTRGDTLGVFQFESAGMIAALKSLRPDAIEDLIALGALYRPGPMDNIPTYIEVKHGRQKPDYLHPLLEPVLRETYGVIIYQEQVQKIAQILAGYTLGGADLLRRAMGKKIKAEMDAQRALFAEGAAKNNVDPKQAEHIFDLVAKFAGYGFNKSHAAAYAVVAYQTAYIKANYPVPFIAASMTYEMGSTDKLAQFVNEAKRMRIPVLPPDVNASEVEFSVESLVDSRQSSEASTHDSRLTTHDCVRYALSAIKNVGAGAMAAIVAERKANGPFKDIQDFAQRVNASDMNRRQIEHLVMAGAFDSLHPNRRQLMESMDAIIGAMQAATQERGSAQVSLFGDAVSKQQMSQFALKQVDEWGMLDKLNQECAAIGFYLSAHPLDPYTPLFKKLAVVPSTMLQKPMSDRQKINLAGILTASKIRTGPRGRSAFLNFTDAHGPFEVAVFDEYLLNQQHDLLKTGKALFLNGEVRSSERGQRVTVSKIQPLEEVAGQVRANSLRVRVEEVEKLEQFKALLGPDKGRGARVELAIPVPSGTVTMKLTGAYDVATDALMQIQGLKGLKVEAG